ncbi:unnamed protein product [Dibothriocephalus latus]|uniref:Uncharacterized protein n=1 Tax=Dibothriocephalus latus TaxID=60516 RepID=A0A3P7NNU1_DIBLA|nr:unnamed protein product [Dibothriocephalus latus]
MPSQRHLFEFLMELLVPPDQNRRGSNRRYRTVSTGAAVGFSEPHVGYLFAGTEGGGRTLRKVSESSDTPETTTTPSKSFSNHPSQQLLQQRGFTFHQYNKFRAACLRDRELHGKGLSQVC